MAKRKAFNFSVADRIIASERGEYQENADVEKEVEMPSLVKNAMERIERTSNPVARAFNFRFIPREKIVFHKNNSFPIEKIEQTAESILEFGLIHNLEVLYDEEGDKYIIEAGERRTRAIDMLIERFRNYDGDISDRNYQNYLRHVHQFDVEGYPANVKFFNAKDYNTEYDTEKARELSEIDSELRVDEANLEVRDYNEENIRKIIKRRNELYTRKNALLNKESRINVNAALAEEMGISTRQVMKYKALSNLIPELQAIFDERGISVNDGAGYASLSEENQRQLLTLIENGQGKREVDNLYKQLKDMQVQISSKESEIQKLADEKQKAIEQVERAEESISSIRKEMQEKNAAENNRSKNEVIRLQSELQKESAKLQKAEGKLHQLEQEKQKKIKELEEQLRENTAIKEKPETREFLKASLQLQNQIDMLHKIMGQLREAYAEYERCYSCDTRKEKEQSPEKFLEQIKEMLLW